MNRSRCEPVARVAVLALFWVVVCAACGSAGGTITGASDRAGVSAAHAGYFVPAGAPDPLACTVAADCAPGPAVNPEDGCCDTGVQTGLYARAYLTWRAGWTAATCGGVTCPTLLSPGLPAPCALEPRCEGGRCAGSCSP